MSTQPIDRLASGFDVGKQIPPLEPGDRLTRAEFERRYEAMPDLKKAELIEGVVHMPSPVRYGRHARPHAKLIAWMAVYESGTAGVGVADNATARLDLENEPQPDAMMLIDPECGGQARISGDDYVENAPELVGEVTSSRVSFDLNTKLRVYRRSGVREYIVWRVLDEELDWFVLRADEYVQLEPDTDGLLKSETFPGLWLDAAALLRGDLSTVLTTVQRGLSSPEHVEFVRRLSQQRTP